MMRRSKVFMLCSCHQTIWAEFVKEPGFTVEIFREK